MTMQLHLQTVPARNGQLWIRHGFKVFRRQPLALMGLCGLSLLFSLATSLLPYIGPVIGLMAVPMFSLGFMLSTHLVLQRKAPTAAVFIEPLRLTPERRRSQLLLCGLFALCCLLILLLASWVVGDVMQEASRLMAQKDPDPELLANVLTDPRLIWGTLIWVGGFTALSVPYWHAPALVHWGGQGAAQALFSSTLAVWRNRGAFALNGLLWMGLMVAASAACGLLINLLGLGAFAQPLLFPMVLVLAAVFYSSLYFSFVDCFMFGAPKGVLDEQA